MLKFHWEILGEPQQKALQSLKEFARLGTLGGGTALALQLGHRRSFDLDFFVPKAVSLQLVARIQKYYGHFDTLVRTGDEFSFVSPDGVKITFLFYPYKPLYKSIPSSSVSFFDWKDIALDKAHTIGRRNEWRDYVDLYYCVQAKFSLDEIMKGAEKKFSDSFSEKLFLSQLVYLEDIEETSSVEFLESKSVSREKVKAFFENEIKRLEIL